MNIDLNLVAELKDTVLSSYNEALKLNNSIMKKELNDIVTDTDIYMEKKIIDKIKSLFPEHSIYSEECGNIGGKSEYTWFIDPIDGTINFANGLPMYSTSIALNKNGETVFGFIYDYTNKKCYYAIKGKGAFCNGKEIHVSSKSELADSVISFCLTSHYNIEKINEVLEVEKSLASKVRGLRLIVSAAIELAWCAEGKIDGCLNVKSSAGLGSAAGKLLVAEAGGKVTNIQGNPREPVDTMLVTNGKIHSKLVNALKYVVFVGNITQVIEIVMNETQKPINTYIAGKAYSQAVAGAKSGLNAKILAVMSGMRKNELDNTLSNIRDNNIDTSYIRISNDVDNDIKIVFKDEDGYKTKEEDILKGSAESLNENIIIESEEMLKKAAAIVCQTKINKTAMKKLIEVGYENNVPIILTPSRAENISITKNSENKELIDKVYIIICDQQELEEIFGQETSVEELTKLYPNKLIVINDDGEINYFNGNEYKTMQGTNGEKIKEVGAKDIFIGNFVRSLMENENIEQAVKEAIYVVEK